MWYTPHGKAVCSEPNAPWCNSGNYAAATVMPGVVFAGAIDGTLRGYSTKDGHILWEYQTRHDFNTVNGVPAKGGSIHFQGPTVVGGMLFMSSGWAGQATGNVLMAFGLE